MVREAAPHRRIVGAAHQDGGGARVPATALAGLDGGVPDLANLVVREAQLARFAVDDDLPRDQFVERRVDGGGVALDDGGERVGRPRTAEHRAGGDEHARVFAEPVEAAGDERLHRAGHGQRRGPAVVGAKLPAAALARQRPSVTAAFKYSATKNGLPPDSTARCCTKRAGGSGARSCRR